MWDRPVGISRGGVCSWQKCKEMVRFWNPVASLKPRGITFRTLGALQSISPFPCVQHGFIFFLWCRGLCIEGKDCPDVNVQTCSSGDIWSVLCSVKCVLCDLRQTPQGSTSPHCLWRMWGSSSQGQERVSFSHHSFEISSRSQSMSLPMSECSTFSGGSY